jgi:uncharacterized membrane protein
MTQMSKKKLIIIAVAVGCRELYIAYSLPESQKQHDQSPK